MVHEESVLSGCGSGCIESNNGNNKTTIRIQSPVLLTLLVSTSPYNFSSSGTDEINPSLSGSG